jgi:hypothetical protein
MNAFIRLLLKYWNHKNFIKDPLTTFIGLMLALVATYFFYEGKIDFTQYLEALGLFLALCGINLSNHNKLSIKGVAIVVLLLSGTIGCQKPPSTTHTLQVLDSTYHTFKIVVDTINVKGDTIKLYYENPCPNLSKIEPKLIKRKANNTSLTVKRDSTGSIEIDCGTASYEAYIKYQQKTIHNLRQIIDKKQDVVLQRYTAWYDIAARWISVICISIALLILILKFKPF